MNKSLKRTLLSTLVVPLALGAASASAAMITTWDYEVTNTFSGVTAGGGSVGGVTETFVGGVRKLEWGNGDDGPSSISINDVMGSGLMTNGAAAATGVFTHDNNVIGGQFNTLKTFDLMSTLKLTSTAPLPAGLEKNPPPITFESFFIETPNLVNCGFTSTSNCDDIFTIDNFDDLNAVQTGSGFQFASSFVEGDYTYNVLLELAGLDFLGAELCGVAGADANCVGLVTLEGQENNFQTFLSITAVPEPGTLALLGMGLAGLGFSRRKKAAKS